MAVFRIDGHCVVADTKQVAGYYKQVVDAMKQGRMPATLFMGVPLNSPDSENESMELGAHAFLVTSSSRVSASFDGLSVDELHLLLNG